MSKPTPSQINIAKKHLKKKDAKVCGGCFKKTFEWIQCDSCLLWMYLMYYSKNKCNT